MTTIKILFQLINIFDLKKDSESIFIDTQEQAITRAEIKDPSVFGAYEDSMDTESSKNLYTIHNRLMSKYPNKTLMRPVPGIHTILSITKWWLSKKNPKEGDWILVFPILRDRHAIEITKIFSRLNAQEFLDDSFHETCSCARLPNGNTFTGLIEIKQ